LGHLALQFPARRRQGQVALAPVVLTDGRDHQPLVNQVAEHSVQRLLGDLQDIEQPGHRDPRTAVDEVDRPVMRPAQPALCQHRVRIAREIAIGKEQKLDAPAQLAIGQRRFFTLVILAKQSGAGSDGTGRGDDHGP